MYVIDPTPGFHKLDPSADGPRTDSPLAILGCGLGVMVSHPRLHQLILALAYPEGWGHLTNAYFARLVMSAVIIRLVQA
jgi:hypothetical protein